MLTQTWAPSDSNSTDVSTGTLDIYDNMGNLISSDVALDDSDGETLENQNIAGRGYLWFTVWQNGFAPNGIAIDNVEADVASTAPEPGSFVLAAIGIAGVVVAPAEAYLTSG